MRFNLVNVLCITRNSKDRDPSIEQVTTNKQIKQQKRQLDGGKEKEDVTGKYPGHNIDR
jgi:hypothetical protein